MLIHRLKRAMGLAAVIGAAGLTPLFGQDAIPPPVHAVRFPKDNAVGTLFVRNQGAGFNGKWRRLGEARGVIVSPPGQELLLRLHVDWIAKVSPFAALGPSDLHSLVLASSFSSHRRRPVFHLSHPLMEQMERLENLRELIIEADVMIDGSDFESIGRLTSIEKIMIVGPSLTDKALLRLKGLTNLRWISLWGGQPGDAGLMVLDRFLRLESFTLSVGRPTTTITDEGLAPLRRATGLRELILFDLPVNGSFLEGLNDPESLRRLTLTGSNITATHLPAIEALTGLEELSLSRCKHITGGGWVFLDAMTGLKRLAIDRTEITDRDLAHLGRLHGLEHLDLSGSAISDAGLSRLKPLKSLRHLNLTDTKITPGGFRELQRALPDCTLLYQSPRAIRTPVPRRHPQS